MSTFHVENGKVSWGRHDTKVEYGAIVLDCENWDEAVKKAKQFARKSGEAFTATERISDWRSSARPLERHETFRVKK